MKKLSTLLLSIFIWQASNAHCEVPCGIYGDQARINEIHEHILTIEKAIAKIEELQKQENPNYNQIVRWVNTKEDHANKIQHIASQYFLTQRILFDSGNYQEKLKALHEIIVYAMKTKQSVDNNNVVLLKSSTTTFERLYFEEKHEHKH